MNPSLPPPAPKFLYINAHVFKKTGCGIGCQSIIEIKNNSNRILHGLYPSLIDYLLLHKGQELSHFQEIFDGIHKSPSFFKLN